MTSSAQVVWLALPLILAGLVHVAVLERGLLVTLAELPLDGGLLVRGRRLLGAHKTLRGVVVMVGATVAFVCLQASLARHYGWARRLSLVDFEHTSALVWGLVLGGGYLAGELPNSFAKRQLGAAPGERPSGRLAPVFWLADQLDSLAGALLFMCAVWVPPGTVVVGLLALTLVVHPAVGLLMVALGLKSRIG